MSRYWKLGLSTVVLVGFFGSIVLYNMSGGDSLGDQGVTSNEFLAIFSTLAAIGALITLVIKSRQSKNQG